MNENRIIYTAEDGSMAVIIPAPAAGLTLAEIAAKDVPAGAEFAIVEAAALPADRLFRNAWRKTGVAVVEDLAAAKEIAHGRRREARAAEFAPLDVEATIPAKAAAAEAARQVIRDKYSAIQLRIDEAADTNTLRAELAALPA